MGKMPESGLWVDEVRAQKLEDLVKSQPWGPREKTLANGTLQLLADRRHLLNRIRKAVLASEESKCKDAIQDMLAILDPNDSLWEGWSDEAIERLRAQI